MCKKFPNFRVKYHKSSTICLRSFVTSGSSIKSQVLDLKTLPIFSPLKISVKVCSLICDMSSPLHSAVRTNLKHRTSLRFYFAPFWWF